MTLPAHAIAISCYLAAALLAAAPLARPLRPPVRVVTIALALGVAAHAAGLLALFRIGGSMAFTGLGPSLSFAAFAVAASLLLVELLAREVTLTLAAAPLAALAAVAGQMAGLDPLLDEAGSRGTLLALHIVLAFLGLGAYATAAAAGAMYMVAHRDLKSHRFGAIFRSFPPLATLDRVNHVSALAGFLGLTLAVVLAATYAIAYGAFVVPKVAWAGGAWLAVTVIAMGRLRGTFQARKAAMLSASTFALVLVLYILVRLGTSSQGHFL